MPGDRHCAAAQDDHQRKVDCVEIHRTSPLVWVMSIFWLRQSVWVLTDPAEVLTVAAKTLLGAQTALSVRGGCVTNPAFERSGEGALF